MGPSFYFALFNLLLLFLSASAPMEDFNSLAADCVVIACCCQCLLLQIIVFAIVKLPCKLVRRTKKLIARRKLRLLRKKGGETMAERDVGYSGDGEPCIGDSVRAEEDDFCGEMTVVSVEEVEEVLEKMTGNGEFEFGSFWRRNQESEHEFGRAINYHAIEIVSF